MLGRANMRAILEVARAALEQLRVARVRVGTAGHGPPKSTPRRSGAHYDGSYLVEFLLARCASSNLRAEKAVARESRTAGQP